MLYHWYVAGHEAVKPARAAADGYRLFFRHPLNPLTHTPVGRHAAAACEVFERATRRYDKPGFGIPETTSSGQPMAVTEEIVWRHPFCNLVHFVKTPKSGAAPDQPRLLLVAPMSGHYATLLRGTVETFLPDHDVYITDWQNARDVATKDGSFDLDDYVDVMIDIFRHFRGDVHVFAVCQPSVPVLAAIATMEAAGDKCVPRTMMLAGGPIDTRQSPTAVNKLAEERGTEWFRNNVISVVPWPAPGYGRRVYPGFLQLTGFMTMNLDRHVNAHKDLFFHLVRGDGDGVEKHREFYDEYLAVMDLSEEFYIQTIESVFVEHHLPRGLMKHRGKTVDLTAIRNVALMTIEGENDDITGKGQCSSAITLCASIPAADKEHYECPKVGHYGIFNGSRFRSLIAPKMAQFLRRYDQRTRFAPANSIKFADTGIDAIESEEIDNGDWIGGEEPAFAVSAGAAAANVNAVLLAAHVAERSLDVVEKSLPLAPLVSAFDHGSDRTEGSVLPAPSASPTPWKMLTSASAVAFEFWSRMAGVAAEGESSVASGAPASSTGVPDHPQGVGAAGA